MVDLVSVLAVEPGVGGQAFQVATLDKVRALRAAFPEAAALPNLSVDGGIDADTAPLAAAAGANVLVSGSHLVRGPATTENDGQDGSSSSSSSSMAARFAKLEALLVEHGR